MGMQDRDYYRDHYRNKRDYQAPLYEFESAIGYSMKRSLMNLIGKSLFYIFLLLILLVAVRYYKAQIRAVIHSSYGLPDISSKQPIPALNHDQPGFPELSTCISNDTSCFCYGKLSERLSIPQEVCREAINRRYDLN